MINTHVTSMIFLRAQLRQEYTVPDHFVDNMIIKSMNLMEGCARKNHITASDRLREIALRERHDGESLDDAIKRAANGVKAAFKFLIENPVAEYDI